MASNQLIVLFREIDKRDIPLVGGKGANLGEMVKAGFPVPDGYAVTVQAYDLFLDENGIRDEINEILGEVDVHDGEALMRASKRIERRIMKARMPDEVKREVVKSYKRLSGRMKKALVAVRSSATAEDLPGASFAGQQATLLNVKGDANLLQAVKECWASLFTARAIFYRNENKIAHKKVKISVIVQKMIQSEVSGVMFSIDPVTNDKDRIIIEAVWGLGELIVQGSVVPDTYTVQKDTWAILAKEISDQAVQLTRKGQKTSEIEVSKKKRGQQKLSNEEIVELAKIANKLQEHYYFPQDVEWAKEGNKLYLVQTRPVTTMEQSGKAKAAKDGTKTAETPILKGMAASPGMGTGFVKVLRSPKQIDEVKQGDVLVAEMTSPDYVPAMKRAAAIVTDQGGLTSHAAIVSRELGVPCIVGTKEATKRLKNGFVVTVDGSRGQVYLGGKVRVEKQKGEEKKKERGYM